MMLPLTATARHRNTRPDVEGILTARLVRYVEDVCGAVAIPRPTLPPPNTRFCTAGQHCLANLKVAHNDKSGAATTASRASRSPTISAVCTPLASGNRRWRLGQNGPYL